MAGIASTSADTTAQAHSSLVDLDQTDDAGESQVSTSEGSSSAAELEELRAQNKRYKEQMSGWQAQSASNKQERDALADRLARLEGHVAATAAPKTQETKPTTGLPKGKLGSALKKWLDNDETELNEIEEYLDNARSGRRSEPEDIEAVVTRTLQKFGTKSTLTTQIGKAHPEMADTNSPLYGAVFDNYDAYANDPDNRVFFPKDEQFMVSVPSPDGNGVKSVDARIVRQLAAELKAQGNLHEDNRQQRETRAASFGAVQTGNGRTTGAPRSRNVEAIELLTQGERDEMQNLKMMKAWPKEWPKDEKAAAKMIYDNLTPAEKAQRTAEYRRQRG